MGLMTILLIGFMVMVQLIQEENGDCQTYKLKQNLFGRRSQIQRSKKKLYSTHNSAMIKIGIGL